MADEPTPAATLAHPALAQLNDALDGIREAPSDEGRLHLIVRRPAVGAREVLEEGELDPATGLVGDTWDQRGSRHTADGSSHPEMQITLMSVRAIGAIIADEARWPLAGDQLFVDLDLTVANLPPGTRLDVGDATLEVTAQPHTGCSKFVARFGLDAMKWVNSPAGRALNLRGIYARVVQGGHIRRGDMLRKA